MKLAFLYAGQEAKRWGWAATSMKPIRLSDRMGRRCRGFLSENLVLGGAGRDTLPDSLYATVYGGFAAGITRCCGEEGIVPSWRQELSLGEYSALHAARCGTPPKPFPWRPSAAGRWRSGTGPPLRHGCCAGPIPGSAGECLGGLPHWAWRRSPITTAPASW